MSSMESDNKDMIEFILNKNWHDEDAVWVNAKILKNAILSLKGQIKMLSEEKITAQHEETGRLWVGPKNKIPHNYFIIKGVHMNDVQFKAFMELLMCSDPWPVKNKYNKDEGQEILVDFANQEAGKRGFETWIDAFHKMIIMNERSRFGVGK